MASEVVRAVLNHAWSALEPLGHDCALMGGVALAVWNYPRATRDVDFLIGVDHLHIQPVIAQLVKSGCRPKATPPLTAVGTLHLVQFLYTPPGEFYDVQFDLMLAESELQKLAIARRVERHVPGIDRPIFVLHCDDLILLKLLAGRMIDRADAAMLLRENRETIDSEYLLNRTKRLGLGAELAEVWLEAFPGQELPRK